MESPYREPRGVYSEIGDALEFDRVGTRKRPSGPIPAASPITRVWIFVDGRFLFPRFRSQGLRAIEMLQVTDAVLVLNRNDFRTFRLYQIRRSAAESETELVNISQDLRRRGIDVHLMTWLRPDGTFIRSAAQTMLPLCTRTEAQSILFDVEREWRVARVDHRRVVEDHFVHHFSGVRCELGVTSFASPPAAVIPLVERCDYVLPQAYRLHWQNLAHSRWRSFGLDDRRKRMVMGLAAGRGDGSVPSPEMRCTFEIVQRLTNPSIRDVAYWSLRWCFVVQGGLPILTPQGRFIRQIAHRVRSRAGRGPARIPVFP
jgi:hypothetical protein